MFRQLRMAYDEGNLERVHQLVERAAAGLFDATHQDGDTDERRKDLLKARIAGIRESTARTRVIVQEIKCSTTYQTMMESTDWFSLFEEQAKLLDQEIEKLCETLKEIPDENT